MTFHARADEYVRLYVGGEKLVDCWEKNACKPIRNVDATAQSTQLRGGSGTFSMIRDQLYDITLEYKEEEGAAAVQLLWSNKMMAGEQVIGERHLLYRQDVSAGSTRQVLVVAGPSVLLPHGSLICMHACMHACIHASTYPVPSRDDNEKPHIHPDISQMSYALQ